MIYYNTTPVRVGKNWHLIVNGELVVVPVLAGRAAIDEVVLEAAAAAVDAADLIVTEVPVQVPKLPPISEIPTNPNPPGERPIKPVDSVDPEPKPDPIIPAAQKIEVSEDISTSPPKDVGRLEEEELVGTKVRLTDDSTPATQITKTGGGDPPKTAPQIKTWHETYFTDENVMPNVDTENTVLESVDVYKSIDLISEGEIDGLCDARGNLIQLVNDTTNTAGSLEKNENGFRGIYLNDVPVKNTNSNTLNYTRVFAEIKYGTADQGMLANSSNPALSLRASSQTFNVGLTLPDLNATNYQAVWGTPVPRMCTEAQSQSSAATPLLPRDAEYNTIPFQQGAIETLPPGINGRFYQIDWHGDNAEAK